MVHKHLGVMLARKTSKLGNVQCCCRIRGHGITPLEAALEVVPHIHNCRDVHELVGKPVQEPRIELDEQLRTALEHKRRKIIAVDLMYWVLLAACHLVVFSAFWDVVARAFEVSTRTTHCECTAVGG